MILLTEKQPGIKLLAHQHNWKFHSILTHLFHCKLTQVFHLILTHLFHCKLTQVFHLILTRLFHCKLTHP
jgi:hypothetical protein